MTTTLRHQPLPPRRVAGTVNCSAAAPSTTRWPRQVAQKRLGRRALPSAPPPCDHDRGHSARTSPNWPPGSGSAGHPVSAAEWEAGHGATLQYYAAAPERLTGKQIPVAGGLDDVP